MAVAGACRLELYLRRRGHGGRAGTRGRRVVSELNTELRVTLGKIDEPEIQPEGSGGIRYGVDEPNAAGRDVLGRDHLVRLARPSNAYRDADQRHPQHASH